MPANGFARVGSHTLECFSLNLDYEVFTLAGRSDIISVSLVVYCDSKGTLVALVPQILRLL